MRKNYFLRFLILLSAFAFGTIEAQYSGSGTFSKITSVADVTDGYYVIVEESDTNAMSNNHNGKLFSPTAITLSSGKIIDPAATIVWKIETNGSGRTIYSEDTQKYASYTGRRNQIQAVDNVTADNQRWDFAYASNKFVVTNKAVTNRILQYNSGAPRFVCYTSNQKKLLLYKLETGNTTSPSLNFDSGNSSIIETNVDQTITVPVTMANYDGNQVDISVSVNSISTAEQGDYTLDTTSLSFTADGSQNISLTIKDDADFDNETIVLDITETTTTGIAINTAQHTLTVTDDEVAPVVLDFKNPDVENWVSGKPEHWSKAENVTQETNLTNVHSGTSSVKVTSGSSTRDLAQTITGIIAGRTYRLSLWYKVESGDNTSARIWSYWKNGANNVTDSATDGLIRGPQNAYLDNANNQWKKYEVIIKAPATSDTFYLEMRTYSGAVVYYDDFEFVLLNNWTGTSNTTWSDTSNWEFGQAPGVGGHVLIPSGLSNYPTLSTVPSINTITIENGASLVVQTANPIATNVTYKRTINDTNWHLITSPVAGEKIDNIITNNPLATGNNDPNHIGLSAYNGGAWSYYNSSSTGNLVSGVGNGIKLTGMTDVAFTGNLNTANVVVNTNSGFNLVGNPYTAYISADLFLDDSNNTNTLSEQTIWFWNGTSYEAKPKVDLANFYIAPAQGFFIKANNTGTTVTFDIANQAHNTTDTFMRNSRPEVHLTLREGTNESKAKLYYIDGVTKGFDNGYDASMFTDIPNNLALFTHLADKSQDTRYQVQSLPTNIMETEIISLGVIAQAGKELVFSAEDFNLPNGVGIYLEDKVTGEITNLSNENYKITLTENTDGVGRFYVNISARSLGVEDNRTSNVTMLVNKSVITIKGLNSKEAMVEVYNISGEQVYSKKTTATGVKVVKLPELSTGIYVVKISSDLGVVTKKVIIE